MPAGTFVKRPDSSDTKSPGSCQDTRDHQSFAEYNPLDTENPRRLINRAALSPRDVLHLQSTIGNQAVMRVLNRVNRGSSADPRPTITPLSQPDRSEQGNTQDPSVDIAALTETARSHPRNTGATAVQRARIPTDFGSFEDKDYHPVPDKGHRGDEIGVEITLIFEPDDAKVNATKIGMSQSVRNYSKNIPMPIDPKNAKTMTKAGDHIDATVKKGSASPIYQEQNVKSSGSAEELPPSGKKGFTHYGWCSTKKDPPKLDAEMYDRPTLIDPPNDSGQVFETTALAIEGAQEGTYYGSVSWGWTKDSAGKYHQQDLKRESKGDPTSKFLDAAKEWNKFELPAKLEPTGKPNEYRVKEPVTVSGKFGGLTLAVGSLVTRTGSDAGDKVMVSIGASVRLSDSVHNLVHNIPKDNVDTKTSTIKKDTQADLTNSSGVSVTIKAGAKLRDVTDRSEANAAPSVMALVKEGTIELPSKMDGSIDKAAVEGAKTTKLPIPGKKP